MNTKEAIKAEFMKEYETKNEYEISVKELCANTPVARTTFYSYYSNLDEVKEEIENELIDRLEEVAPARFNGDYENMDFRAYLMEIQKVIKDHWSYFYIFLIRQPDLRFIGKWKESIKTNFLRKYPEKRKIRNHELITDMVGAATIDGYMFWMRHPDAVSVEDMIGTIADALKALTATI